MTWRYKSKTAIKNDLFRLINNSILSYSCKINNLPFTRNPENRVVGQKLLLKLKKIYVKTFDYDK